MTKISSFIKYHRKKQGLTQEELANKAGVGVRFIRELEQGKETLQLDKVNHVLAMFGFNLAPAKQHTDAYEIALELINDIRSKYFKKAVKITLINQIVRYGFIIKEIIDPKENIITGWQFVPNNNAVEYQQQPDDQLTEIIPHSSIQQIEEQ